ncbi:Kynurenine/alpha-aminoadipate aminotransferase, mitochondrial [Lamellibrachia satsuma]|nr:Kynurenine/alpha-aminoadipate aminotransferase, mitochondrial [Lamellibrachia satsuma]
MQLRPLGCRWVTVDSDKFGMIPESLKQALSRWKPSDINNVKSDIPKFMYINPTGGNPTGMSMSLERKREIYQLAREYDLIILEDDPYYFMQFNEMLIPSFLSIDTDGRVIRFDSFSKMLSAGLRVGYVTGPGPLVQKIQFHIMSSIFHASSLSQALVSELLLLWGVKGYLKNAHSICNFYQSQRDLALTAAQKWLTDLADWRIPQAGMFLWLKVKAIRDTKYLIEVRALKKQVLFVAGCHFMADADKPCPFIRVSYSLATPVQLDLVSSQQWPETLITMTVYLPAISGTSAVVDTSSLSTHFLKGSGQSDVQFTILLSGCRH